MERRILDATLRCIARWGVGKTTLDDIAREAGCSRATLYRVFPGGKDSLLERLVAAEVERFFASLAARLDGIEDLEELLVTGILHTHQAIAGHAALQFLLAHEPEVVLPRVSFSQADRVLDVVSAAVAPWLAPHVGDAEAPRAGEWLARIVLSYSMCPPLGVAVIDEESVRSLVRTYVLPGLRTTVPQS